MRGLAEHVVREELLGSGPEIKIERPYPRD
jgi:hypothetical protein